MSSRKIFLRPEYSHPSSLWPSEELIVTGSKKRGFYLPEDIGIKPEFGNEILEWTRDFSTIFSKSLITFSSVLSGKINSIGFDGMKSAGILHTT